MADETLLAPNLGFPPSIRPATTILRSLRCIAYCAALGLVLPAHADQATIVGLWRTIDDVTGKPRGLVRIYESNGEFLGKIERGLAAEDHSAAVCTKCTDARKNQPFFGMVILSGLRREGSEYVGGEVLDPDSGKVYRARVRLEEGGRQLNMRGYIGIELFGRSQTWVREE